MRQMFYDTWSQYNNNLPLEGAQSIILEVIHMHSEYQAVLEDRDQYIDKDYLPEFGETNPFLHMAMHISIVEQIHTDRPMGIRLCYEQLNIKTQDQHRSQHLILDCLGKSLLEAQHSEQGLDETSYLNCIRALAR